MNLAGRHFSWLSLVCCGLVVVGVALVVGFGFGVGPWLIVMGAFCVVMMGSMLWMMVGMGSYTAHRVAQSGSDRREAPLNKEIAVATLDRRFAEGEINPDEYRVRRVLLADDTVGATGAVEGELLTTPGGGEGRAR